jgi:hypothetical protein
MSITAALFTSLFIPVVVGVSFLMLFVIFSQALIEAFVGMGDGRVEFDTPHGVSR